MLKVSPPPTPPRVDHPLVRSIQRRSVALLVAAALLNYFDRSALAVANPLIRADLHLSVAQMGLLLSAFLWAYAFAQLPIGALLDRIGPKRALGLGLVLWSAAQAAGGRMNGVAPFVAARALLGVGEGPMFPAASAVVRDWFRMDQRTSATGVWNSAPAMAQALAPPALTLLMTLVGWRWMFATLGLAGLGLALVWMLAYRDRRRRMARTVEQAPFAAGWGRLFSHRMTWGLMAGNFGVIYVLWLYSTWLPGYLEIERHLSIKSAGMVAAIPFALSIGGSIGGGLLVDHIARSGRSLIRTQKAFVCLSLTGMGLFTFAAAHASSVGWAIGEISAALFCNGCATCMAWAIATTAAPKGYVGALGGIQNFAGYLGGALAPMVTGLLVQATGTFTPALVTGAVIALASAASYALIVPREPMRL
ncbi:MAG: MFS transporter [Caulobacteraceae bacterium]